MRGRSHRLGWDGGDLSPLFFSETAAGSIGIPTDEFIPNGSWKGTFFMIPGVFNRPDIIKFAGGGRMQVLQSGIYQLNAYMTTANLGIDTETNVRFTRNLTEVVANSQHQIFEKGTNNDRDMIAKGVPVYLNAGDLIEAELSANVNNAKIQALSNWTIQLLSGLVGTTGPAGSHVVITDEFSAYRNANSSADINFQGIWHNIFQDADASFHAAENYDIQGTFDTASGLWTPRAGKYLVHAGGGFVNITDTAFAYIALYDETLGDAKNWGFLGRNEDTSGSCNSTLSCQFSADGLTSYTLRCKAVNDTSVTIRGDAGQTFLTAYRFTETP